MEKCLKTVLLLGVFVFPVVYAITRAIFIMIICFGNCTFTKKHGKKMGKNRTCYSPSMNHSVIFNRPPYNSNLIGFQQRPYYAHIALCVHRLYVGLLTAGENRFCSNRYYSLKKI